MDIFRHDKFSINIENILFWCAISALSFTIVPFATNIYYAVTIPDQKIIKSNTAASSYLKNHLAEFVLLVVFTGIYFLYTHSNDMKILLNNLYNK